MDTLIYSFISDLPTIGLFLIIAAMLFTISKGADLLVDEAVSLSVRWGIPKMVIGATIVSLGTTLPEASVSVMAAINGKPDLALGNAIGSIIVDTGLIIGIASLLGRIPIDDMIIKRQGRMQFWLGILLTIVALPIFSATEHGSVSQMVGIIFVILLIAYIVMSIKWSKESGPNEEEITEDGSSVWLQLAKVVFGIAVVILSSKILIPSVEVSAIRIGIPESIIAATIVAFGTSLPELVTAITAVKKGHGELAVGNVVGADILNILFVVGSAAAVTKGGLVVPNHFYHLQFPAMVLILLSFRLFSLSKKRTISKLEGGLLLAFYLVYLVLNYI